MFGTPSVALIAKESRPRGNKNNQGMLVKKGSCHPQRAKVGIVKKQKAKGNREKNSVCEVL